MKPLRTFLAWMTLLLPIGCAKEGKHRLGSSDNLPRTEVVQPNLVEYLPRRIDLTVTVEPMAKVDLSARVPGIIKFLPDHVDIGYKVKAGEKLVELDVPDLIAQKAYKTALHELAVDQKTQVLETRKVLAKELEEAKRLEKRFEAEFNARTDEYERTRMLVERGALSPDAGQEKMRLKEAAHASWRVSQAQIETKAVKLEASDIDERVAESKIKIAKAEIQNLTVQIEYATITAPFAGVVTRRWVDPGAMVKDASAPLLTIMRVDQVRALVDIPDRDASFVNATEQNPNPNGKGDPVRLHFPALTERGAIGDYDDFIRRRSEARDPATRTMRAEIQLDNKLGLIQPGMFGNATLLLEERRNVLTIPTSALLRRGDSYEVLCLANATGDPPRGVVKRVPVQTGLDDGTQVEILSGVTRDMWIIVKRSSVVEVDDEMIGVPARRP